MNDKNVHPPNTLNEMGNSDTRYGLHITADNIYVAFEVALKNSINRNFVYQELILLKVNIC